MDKKHLARSENRVKWRAFLPSNTDHRTSVFCTSGLTLKDIWQLGVDYVEPNRGKRVLGGGELFVGEIEATGLGTFQDEPPPRHANIEGWPDEKDEWKQLAIELAAIARLHIR